MTQNEKVDANTHSYVWMMALIKSGPAYDAFITDMNARDDAIGSRLLQSNSMDEIRQLQGQSQANQMLRSGIINLLNKYKNNGGQDV